MVAALAPFVLLGLLGAVHCAGMCGGFAVAVGARATTGTRRAFLGMQLAYLTGKALTYAVLGLLLSTGGRFVAGAAAHGPVEETVGLAPHGALAGLREASAWLAGLTMVWFGLRMLGISLPGSGRTERTQGRVERRLAALVRGARSLPGGTGALATGLATGFLPCGLSWSAFALAAGNEPLVAFAGLLAFGLATAPALLLSAWGWRGLSAVHRATAVRLAGPLLLAFGVFTIARGFPVASAEVLPECCQAAHTESP